ncbi:ester cyclase [Shewanella gelidimarina]|uniref:ester cyclase n=1 Tax=Shewanella gelidimarina TaxID=56813 RepID=UPI00200DF5F3|nr:ester cyclase [Shewanella gelidimarina]MCL1056732.1 ester cyclase [Shewanella gelidimarina]
MVLAKWIMAKAIQHKIAGLWGLFALLLYVPVAVSAATVIQDESENAPAVEAAAKAYAQFWNTGDEKFASIALSPHFIDRTLPEGRQQGIAGVLEASKSFRQAVPDLTAEVEQLLVVKDRAVVRLRFKGHFSGQFGQHQGKGQPINFAAVDIYRVQDGLITDNWHLEDYNSLFTQMEF